MRSSGGKTSHFTTTYNGESPYGKQSEPGITTTARRKEIDESEHQQGNDPERITGREQRLERDSLDERKFKWATIQAYYSMFHSARALLYSRGYRERSHHGLSVALRVLFGNQLGTELTSAFEEGMELRQEANYGLKFSEEGALETADGAEELLTKASDLLKDKRQQQLK